MKVDFKRASLEAQDGYWERALVDGRWRVRPVPGYEGYDRILLVAPAFPVPRRIETDVTYRHGVPNAREQGFGVLALWNGHPDDWSTLPRRGWSFSLAWYWTKPGGAGNEISYKYGAGSPVWVNGYQDVPFRQGIRYKVIVEDYDERDTSGQHVRFRQRLKWWPATQPEPRAWQELTDVPGSPLPEGEYGVALLAYNCQVEFGAVRIRPLANDQPSKTASITVPERPRPE